MTREFWTLTSSLLTKNCFVKAGQEKVSGNSFQCSSCGIVCYQWNQAAVHCSHMPGSSHWQWRNLWKPFTCQMSYRESFMYFKTIITPLHLKFQQIMCKGCHEILAFLAKFTQLKSNFELFPNKYWSTWVLQKL